MHVSIVHDDGDESLMPSTYRAGVARNIIPAATHSEDVLVDAIRDAAEIMNQAEGQDSDDDSEDE